MNKALTYLFWTLGLFAAIFLAVIAAVFVSTLIIFLIPAVFVLIVLYLGYRAYGKGGIIVVLNAWTVLFLILGAVSGLLTGSIASFLNYLIVSIIFFVISFLLSRIWKLPVLVSLKKLKEQKSKQQNGA